MFRTPYSKADWVFTLLIVGMFCGSGWCHWRKQRLLTRGIHVQGTVVQTNRHPGGRSGFYEVDRPSVSYKDTAGRTWTLVSEFETIRKFKIGQPLPVVYDPADPAGGEIEPGYWKPSHMSASGDFFLVGTMLFVPFAGWRYLEYLPVRRRTPATPASP